MSKPDTSPSPFVRVNLIETPDGPPLGLMLSQSCWPKGLMVAPLIFGPQAIAVLPEEIDSLIESLSARTGALRTKYNRGTWMRVWPEALRQLQAVIDGDDEMTNDAEHDLLVELAQACGLKGTSEAVHEDEEEEGDYCILTKADIATGGAQDCTMHRHYRDEDEEVV